MASTVVYRLYSSAFGAGVTNTAQLAVIKSGRITAVSINIAGIGGAGTGVMAVEITKNTNAGGTQGTNQINNPQREISIAAINLPWNTSTAGGCNVPVQNISIPIAVGDYINVGTSNLSGTAPSPVFMQIAIYVLEG